MISYRKVRAATGQWRVWPGIRHIKQDWVSAILSNVTRQLLLNDTEVELCHIQAYCNVQAMILQLISPFSIFILKYNSFILCKNVFLFPLPVRFTTLSFEEFNVFALCLGKSREIAGAGRVESWSTLT